MPDKKLISIITAITISMFFLALQLASASLNVSLSDQGTGVILKSTGASVNSSNLTISIYDAVTGGNLIHNETFVGGIINGSWNVMLGENTSNQLSLEFGKLYYKDYAINNLDLDFQDYAGSTVERQLFYSPLGDVNTSVLANSSVDSSKILDESITDIDISNSTNLTLGQKITFAFGEIIDNIIDGWISITGGLSITGNLTVRGNYLS